MREWLAFEKQAKFCMKYVNPPLVRPLDATKLKGIYIQKYNCSFANCIAASDQSAAALVNLLARDFSCFRDEVRDESGKKVRFLKRAQIVVADLWACFEGAGYGGFHDIDQITMFADYRIPQILNCLGCLGFSPLLDAAVRDKKNIPSGSNWEMQLRGKSRPIITAWTILIRQQDAAYGA